MADTTLTPSRLWKTMTFEQRQRVARAFWQDEEAVDDQTQAALLIAQQKKFRPKTVIGLDIDRKARHLASIVPLSEPLAGRLLILYHLTQILPLVVLGGAYAIRGRAGMGLARAAGGVSDVGQKRKN